MTLINLINQAGAYVIYGLSTDIKPSAPNNSLFIETDTAMMYLRSSNTWVVKSTGANLQLSDTTDNNATTSRHGFLPKLEGSTSTFLRGDGTFATPASSGGDMLKSENLSGLANYTTARTNLGLGTLATQSGTFSGTSSGTNTGDNAVNSLYSGLVSNATHTGEVTGSTALTITANAVTNAKLAQMATKTYKGKSTAGTGDVEDVPVATLKTDLALVKADVGLGNVDNTSDASKPVSTATQTALDSKAPLASPTFTGTVTLPVQTVSLAMQANMPSSSLVYRKTAGAGVPETQPLATLKTDLGLTGTNSGDQTIVLSGAVSGSGTGAITTTLQNSVVGTANLSATGTPSASTYLRGDNTWATPSGGGSFTVTETEIDFGATPVSEASFTITDAGMTSTKKILVSMSYATPTGKDQDELEMDYLLLRAVAGTGNFTLYATSSDGSYLEGTFKINYSYA